ncbi:hypothetical protein ERX46_07100 [Brumimicrobium glaciale]|uniref:Uncharacterized protein n=1 Tax=Brumimicrobium glaciale TaxID=200475 RepID=A0A4Q4KQH3_9FLAO|nr:hypothetical protein [Brumimicrobium glaciale]RYM35137.1 hypothetical protein ERX46_07100 [Brumimicrobium glaciale]
MSRIKSILASKVTRNIGKVIFILLWIIVITFSFNFITESLSNYFDPEPDWDKVGISTIGTVSSIKTGRPNYTDFTFEVNGEEYMAPSSFSPYGLTYTEKYEILYSKENYEKIKVIEWRPIILEDEEIDFLEIEAKVTKLINSNPFSLDSDFSGIRFEFNLNGKTVDKTQSLPPYFRELYPNIEKVKTCKVKYWKYDPQRAILLLDECR